MKYILLCIVTILLCVFAGIAITRRKSGGVDRGPGRTVIMTIVFIVLLTAEVSLWYLAGYYHAGKEAHFKMMSGRTVSVHKTDGAYLFDGPGDDCALIFYPGAKVEEKAYAPLMYRIADRGIDCYLLRVPFHMAMLSINASKDIMDEYDYEEWYVGGHSLGGTAASAYYSDNTDDVDGLILLASYPTTEMTAGSRLLSIYGSEDGCLDRAEYDKCREYWPDDSAEIVIEGGNHADFGDYGPQEGDGEASISPEEQQKQTADAIRQFCMKEH